LSCKLKKHLANFSIQKLYSIPEFQPGVYGLWYGDYCIYIGQSQDQGIKERLIQHWSGSHNDDLKDWIAGFGSEIEFGYKIIEKAKIDYFEQFYIRKFQPSTNIIRYGA
jgi:hypothetical protein